MAPWVGAKLDRYGPRGMMVVGAVLSAIGFLLLGTGAVFPAVRLRAHDPDGRGPCAGVLLRGERHGGPVVRQDAGAGRGPLPYGSRRRQGDHFPGGGLAAGVHRLASGVDTVRRAGGGNRGRPGGHFHAAEPGRYGASSRRGRRARIAERDSRRTRAGGKDRGGAGAGHPLDPKGGEAHVHLLAHHSGVRHGGHGHHRRQSSRRRLRVGPGIHDVPGSPRHDRHRRDATGLGVALGLRRRTYQRPKNHLVPVPGGGHRARSGGHGPGPLDHLSRLLPLRPGARRRPGAGGSHVGRLFRPALPRHRSGRRLADRPAVRRLRPAVFRFSERLHRNLQDLVLPVHGGVARFIGVDADDTETPAAGEYGVDTVGNRPAGRPSAFAHQQHAHHPGTGDPPCSTAGTSSAPASWCSSPAPSTSPAPSACC